MQKPGVGIFKISGALGLLLGALCSASALAATITLSSTDFPPYTGEQLPHGGIVTAIAVAAFQRVGYTVNVQYRPWARALQEAKAGLSSGVIGIWRSPEREVFFAYTKPLYTNKVGFYARSDQPLDVQNPAQLKHARIGIVRGYLKPATLAMAHLQTEEANNDEENLVKLAAGRIDLALVDKGLAHYLLNSTQLNLRNRLVWLEPSVDAFPLHTAFSRQSPDWKKHLADFNTGLEAIRKDGTLAHLQHGFGS